MSIMTRIKNFYGIQTQSEPLNEKSQRETVELENLYKFLGIEDRGDPSALSEATYYACHKVLSEAIGKLPFKLQQHTETNGVVPMRNHPLYTVLRDRPNPYMTATTFWSTIEFYRNHYGNGYALITGAGSTLNLWILPSDMVEVWYDDGKLLGDIPDIYYVYSVGGQNHVFSSQEVLHFKTFQTYDGVVGISVRDQLKDTINGNNKAQSLVNKLYNNGMTGKAVLQYTASLNEQNQKAFTKGIQKYVNGELASEGIQNIIPLPFGASLQPLNMKLSDSQFLEIKQYSALQIASAFGIKPYQIGDYTKSSYASAEAQQLSFYVDTLLFILKQYEEEVTYKLLSREEVAKGLHAKFNVAVILRADLKTQIDTLSTAVNSFLYTPNEARAKLDLESKPGGDELLGNGASIPVQYAGSQYTSIDGETESTDVVEDESDKATPDEIIKIIENVRKGTLTYEQAVQLIVVTIGYDEDIARALLGDESDYEKEEPPIEESSFEENTEGEESENTEEDSTDADTSESDDINDEESTEETPTDDEDEERG